ncbi:hypothetical protein QCA50_006272 [Cerrena zonata]|uniref:Golgi apparatus membrane protein TVP38 n=1 Tax=Cerrena zonata TaxID=2478898 RepID=A0AAW0GHB2_9APHY
MANPYQAYGPDIPTLSYSDPAKFSSDPHGSHGINQESTDVDKAADAVVLVREVLTRSPSPTPEEAAELSKTSMFDWKAMRNWRYWVRKEWRWYYLIGVLVVVFIVLFVAYHTQIVNWLQPAANWMHRTPAGWVIPIVLFVIVSFPPLFGHEIIGILCGLVWGLGIGFAIVATGTFLGEMANFYAFRHCCTARGAKYEKKNLKYAYLVRVIRDGGFKVALVARFSAIPPHFTTAVFSTCGMDVWVFAAAAFFSLPKQFMIVYLGVALEQSQSDGSSRTNKIIKAIVISVTVIVTILAMWWINKKMNDIKPIVIYERRKARQLKLNGFSVSETHPDVPDLEANAPPHHSSNRDTYASSGVPVDSRPSNQSQRRTSDGQTISPDTILHAPRPRRPFSGQPGSKTDSPLQASEDVLPYHEVVGPARQTIPFRAGNSSRNTIQDSNSYAMSRM